jgi:hypothetical protein
VSVETNYAMHFQSQHVHKVLIDIISEAFSAIVFLVIVLFKKIELYNHKMAFLCMGEIKLERETKCGEEDKIK